MPRCPNCNYLLVLLEHRRKYKCAKCGKLFPQREIEDKEFREFNKKRRAKAKKEAKREYRKLYVQENRERVNAWMRNYYNRNREKILAKSKEKRSQFSEREREKSKQSQAEWRENNREYYNQQKREYWANNHEHLIEKKKENYQRRRPQILKQQALYRQNNQTLSRIKNLRDQQKHLSLRIFESNINKALDTQIPRVLPTLVLSYLLKKDLNTSKIYLIYENRYNKNEFKRTGGYTTRHA